MTLALNEICRSYNFWNHCKLYVYNREKTDYLHHSFSYIDVNIGCQTWPQEREIKETLPWSCWFCFNINTSIKCQHPCSCCYGFSSEERLIFHQFWWDTHWWTSKIRMVGFSSEQRKKLASCWWQSVSTANQLWNQTVMWRRQDWDNPQGIHWYQRISRRHWYLQPWSYRYFWHLSWDLPRQNTKDPGLPTCNTCCLGYQPQLTHMRSQLKAKTGCRRFRLYQHH